MSTDKIDAINEIFRKQLSVIRKINNALEVKIKEQVQRLEEIMVIIKANEIHNSSFDGQDLAESMNEQNEPATADSRRQSI
jgi:hypothetical protein